jgi:hypothetical protein
LSGNEIMNSVIVHFSNADLPYVVQFLQSEFELIQSDPAVIKDGDDGNLFISEYSATSLSADYEREEIGAIIISLNGPISCSITCDYHGEMKKNKTLQRVIQKLKAHFNCVVDNDFGNLI